MRLTTDTESNEIDTPGPDVCNYGRHVCTDAGVQVQKLLVTVVEASEVLGVSRSVIYELMNSARLPSVSIGRSRRIRMGDLEYFVATLANPRD